MLNKVILIGRLANDPELKWTPSGIPVTTFAIAVDRPMSAEARQSGQEKQTDFIDIVAWRQQAEFASNYLGKGRLVAIDGRLQIRKYQAQDGTNRRVAEVVTNELRSLDRPKEPAGDGEGHRGGDDEHGGGAGRYQERASRPPMAASPAPPRPAAGAAPVRRDAEPHDHDEFAAGDSEMDDPFADE